MDWESSSQPIPTTSNKNFFGLLGGIKKKKPIRLFCQLLIRGNAAGAISTVRIILLRPFVTRE